MKEPLDKAIAKIIKLASGSAGNVDGKVEEISELLKENNQNPLILFNAGSELPNYQKISDHEIKIRKLVPVEYFLSSKVDMDTDKYFNTVLGPQLEKLYSSFSLFKDKLPSSQGPLNVFNDQVEPYLKVKAKEKSADLVVINDPDSISIEFELPERRQLLKTMLKKESSFIANISGNATFYRNKIYDLLREKR